MLKKIQIFKALDTEIKKQKGPSTARHPYKDHKSLKEELGQSGMCIIAEIAGGNPMHGRVRKAFRPSTHAKTLLENGAKALSVATDRFLYGGTDKHLPEVRGVAKCPLIRRDFIFEEYQIEESKILGADAVILTAALLEPERLKALHTLAVAKNLDVIVEVADEDDLEHALEAEAQIICVVGRNLDTWEVSWEKTIKLLKAIPPKKCLKMVEAGITKLQQIKELQGLGVHGVIIGDVLLPEFYPGKRLAQLLAGVEPPKKSKKTPKAPPDGATVADATRSKSSKPQASPSSQRPSKGTKETSMTQTNMGEKAVVAAEPDDKKASAPKKIAPPKADKPAAKKAAAPAKKAATPAKKAVAPAKKAATPAKEAAAPVKKAAAPKKTAAKPVAKKTAAKPAPKKSVAPKKATAKKPVAKKAAAKPVAKKAAPKKTAAKPVVKKALAPKKAAPKAKAAPARKPCGPAKTKKS